MFHIKIEDILSRSNYCDVYIKLYSLKNLLTSTHLALGILINILSSTSLNPHGYWQTICYHFYLMQHSPAPDLLVQQMVIQVQYISYCYIWQPRWTCPQNQPNHTDHCTLLESPLHNYALEDVLLIDKLSCTASKRSVRFFLWASIPEIGGSDWLESSDTIRQGK